MELSIIIIINIINNCTFMMHTIISIVHTKILDGPDCASNTFHLIPGAQGSTMVTVELDKQ